jgi:multidrug efflux system membrane fusion protein
MSVGALVSSGPIRPTVLTTIVSTDPIYVYFSVKEDLLPRLTGKLGALPVDIGFGDGKDFPLKGMLDYLSNRADPTTNTILARAVFSSKVRDVRPGMKARVRLPLGELRSSAQ